jgi:hypothetical protein
VNLVPAGTANVVPFTTVRPSPELKVRSTEEDGCGSRRRAPLGMTSAAFGGAGNARDPFGGRMTLPGARDTAVFPIITDMFGDSGFSATSMGLLHVAVG